jgi:hypothetical protein
MRAFCLPCVLAVAACAGKYSLLLSHPAQRLVAVRLLELFCQQVSPGEQA